MGLGVHWRTRRNGLCSDHHPRHYRCMVGPWLDEHCFKTKLPAWTSDTRSMHDTDRVKLCGSTMCFHWESVGRDETILPQFIICYTLINIICYLELSVDFLEKWNHVSFIVPHESTGTRYTTRRGSAREASATWLQSHVQISSEQSTPVSTTLQDSWTRLILKSKK